MTYREKALEYLSRDRLLHIDMTEAIKRGLCSIDYAAEDGVMLTLEEAIMLSCGSTEKALELLKGADKEYICLHQPEMARAVCSACGYNIDTHCWQAAYLGEPFPEGEEDIRILGMESLDAVAAVYELHDREYLSRLIEEKIMIGAFVDGKLAGFMGKHKEGAQGLLLVLPEYRRLGLASALEKYYANYELSQGNIPYGNIIVGNMASRALQEKLGMSFAEGTVQWLTLKA